MRTIVGQVARGANFWPRNNEIEDIWAALDSGSHILMAAPRRVGKTSIMYKMIDEPKAGCILIYVNTESADSQQEFWQKLFHAIADKEFVASLKSKAKLLWQKLINLKIKKITANGVEFGDGMQLHFVEAFKQLLSDLDKEQRLIILIDEFAQTIENICNYENDKNAISLLKNHRELRQDSKFCQNVSFVYAGSIGLESVVAKLNASRHINDLNSIKIKPLVKEDAKAFTQQLVKSQQKHITDDALEHLLGKIEWLIPFYIQLLVQEITRIQRDTQDISISAVNAAFNEAIEQRQYFESWLSKIKTSFKKEQFIFAKSVLNTLSETYTIKFKQVVNLATKANLDEEAAKEVLSSLVHDGYINNNDNVKTYRFNSPLLRAWWNKNVAN